MFFPGIPFPPEFSTGGNSESREAPPPRFLHTDATPSAPSSMRPNFHPASAAVRNRLPQTIVGKEDLMDESNQECAICLETQRLGAKVTKLPCAHIFCNDCVRSWLEKNNTCPVCRFELPTGNPDYDNKLKSTQHCKAHYRRSELMTLSALELKKLLGMYLVRIPPGCVEKGEIIDALFASGAVEVVPELEDAVYSKAEIEAMTREELINIYRHVRLATPHGEASVEEIIDGLINSGRIQVDFENKGMTTAASPANSSESPQKRKSERKPEPAAQARKSDVSMGVPTSSNRTNGEEIRAASGESAPAPPPLPPAPESVGAATSSISTPAPPRYTVGELKSLSVANLKKLLAEAGVKLPGGLTEKSELVQLVSESLLRSQ